jgi:hypothetical protein
MPLQKALLEERRAGETRNLNPTVSSKDARAGATWHSIAGTANEAVTGRPEAGAKGWQTEDASGNRRVCHRKTPVAPEPLASLFLPEI